MLDFSRQKFVIYTCGKKVNSQIFVKINNSVDFKNSIFAKYLSKKLLIVRLDFLQDIPSVKQNS